MQIIRLNETTAALIEIPFTTVSITNLQTRLSGTTLPNANLLCYIKKAGVGVAVAGTGTFVTVDDTNAVGIRGYQPSVADLALGVATYRFYDTGALMEPREVPVMVVPSDPYKPAYYGACVTGTLTATVFTTDRTETTTDAWKNCFVEFLSGPDVGAVAKIGGFTGTGTVGTFTLASGYTLPATPTAGDKFRLIVD